MFLTILASIGVLLVLSLILRFRAKMAALVAWIVGSIVFTKKAEQKPVDSPKPANRKNKKSNSRQSPTKSTKPKPAAKAVPEITLTEPEAAVPTEDILPLTKQNSESLISLKYQAVSVPETRRRSLDFDVLVDKLENIYEKSDNKEAVVEGDTQKGKGKSRKKRSPTPQKTDLEEKNKDTDELQAGKRKEKTPPKIVEETKTDPKTNEENLDNWTTVKKKAKINKEPEEKKEQTPRVPESKADLKTNKENSDKGAVPKKNIGINELEQKQIKQKKEPTPPKVVQEGKDLKSNKEKKAETNRAVEEKQIIQKKEQTPPKVVQEGKELKSNKERKVETNKEVAEKQIIQKKEQKPPNVVQEGKELKSNKERIPETNSGVEEKQVIQKKEQTPPKVAQESKTDPKASKDNSDRGVGVKKKVEDNKAFKENPVTKKIEPPPKVVQESKGDSTINKERATAKKVVVTEEVPKKQPVTVIAQKVKPKEGELLITSKGDTRNGVDKITKELEASQSQIVVEKTYTLQKAEESKTVTKITQEIKKELEVNKIIEKVSQVTPDRSYTARKEEIKPKSIAQEEICVNKETKKIEKSPQVQQIAQKSEQITVAEKAHTTQEERFVSRLNQIIQEEQSQKGQQQVTQNKETVEKKVLEDLPKSSIIEHYNSKSKRKTSVEQIEAVTQDIHQSPAPQPEVKAKPSNITSEKSPPLVENSQKSPELSKSSQQVLNTKASTMKVVNEVRVLTLNDNEHQDSILYRIEKNWIIQFRLGPSLFGRKVSLYCNYPQTKDGRATQFDRNRYYLLQWGHDEGCLNADDTAQFAEIPVTMAGSFHYYFIYENATESGPQGSGFFLVDPVLKCGDNEDLPLNCIQCQTVLSKCLGPLSTWENKLRVAKESGYNMIHFTPIQALGESNSAYSLSGQLKLNPTFNDNNTKASFADVEKLTTKMRTEWKVLSICDIVLNHTANETDWLEEHPESTFNCLNCSYMRPAYLLDAALHQFSNDVKIGIFETWGVPLEVCTEDHLNAIRHALFTKVLPEINIPEMYTCSVNKLVGQFLDSARKMPPNTANNNVDKKLKLIRDPMYRRLEATVDMDLALQLYNIFRPDSFDEDSRLKRCGEEFKSKLDQLNKEIVDELNIHLAQAVDNSIAGIRYFRVQHDGPKLKEISKKDPLISRYFTDYGTPKSIKEHEKIMYGPNSKYLMAHNGWVMNADPMRNFADSDSNVYVRRELIAWGDSVKLRFGDKPEDSPFLWNHMKTYVEQTAKIFDGVRLDNCHSTPIPVAEYLLDCARRVRPNLYVVAELFTNSDHTDNIFVNRLGISSLIREAMSAWDSHEEGRLVHRYGGDPVGAFFQPHVRPLVPSIAHALFLDLTHDNPTPVEKRSVFDLLPSAALVNMACCASGSNRGYDELVNHHIHVVDENRQYTEWTNDESQAVKNSRYVSYKSGIISAKRAINDLHFKLGIEGFNQVYVDQIDPDIVAVTRHRPETHQSVILVAFTAFGHPSEDAARYQRGIKPLRVEGVLDEIILEATLNHSSAGKSGSKYSQPNNYVKDGKFINGLAEYTTEIKQHIQLENSDVFELGSSGNHNIIQLNFKNFKPGSVVAIKVSLPKKVQESIHKLRELMLSFSRKETARLSDVIGRLNLADLNRALYRCDQEERDDGKGFGTYNIPNHGCLVYCGFQGFMSLLSNIRPSNDLGHAMCGNLRDGNWMIDYICQRLKVDDGTKELGQWIEKSTEPLRDIPRYLIPSYFDVIVTGIYINLLEQAYKLMSDFVTNGSTFVKGLALGSLQVGAVIKSADLPTLSPNLTPPKPPTKQNDQGKVVQACVTLSAGLPHFSTGYMRNWGRDTFIALRGMFILTGRFQEARYHILGYAACLRHGLIPNLLDGGRNSRFNCRDAVWWWLYCIKCYVEDAPNGIEILSDKVSRIFPTDDSPALEPGVVDQPLYEVMQEALKIHFQGLAFRERNAGRQIDEQMTDQGFNNQIGVHPETGFVFGGNEANCGTWMDKMGSSDKAGNRGKPATPRDGSAIELIGLSKAVITWLALLHDKKQYPYAGVDRANKTGTLTKWTFKQWADKIKNSFEQHFWINTVPAEGEFRPDLINKRGIYKDSYGASQPWTDYQLRCNFPIAMVAAPELFDAKHAWIALQNAEKHLLGPLGMKTLDASDWNYCGDYNNADDSSNLKTANGFNYHQGPEWVWPIGFYLRARLDFAAKNGELARTVANTKVVLAKHFTELQTSAWRGLPELTNSNGSYCYDSSRTQAWSMSCVLEVLHDLQRIESKQKPSRVN